MAKKTAVELMTEMTNAERNVRAMEISFRNNPTHENALWAIHAWKKLIKTRNELEKFKLPPSYEISLAY